MCGRTAYGLFNFIVILRKNYKILAFNILDRIYDIKLCNNSHVKYYSESNQFIVIISVVISEINKIFYQLLTWNVHVLNIYILTDLNDNRIYATGFSSFCVLFFLTGFLILDIVLLWEWLYHHKFICTAYAFVLHMHLDR